MIHRLLMFCFIALSVSASCQTTVKKIVLQGFWWDYYNSNYHLNWSNYLTEMAPRLKAAGIDAIWIPPTPKNTSPSYVGYAPFDHYDLGDKFQKGSTGTRMGNKNDLLRMIAVMHANGIEVIQDVVLNHVNSAGSNTGAGGQDPNSFSMANQGGYKNFRYVCYDTPASSETQSNYWGRKGRWFKNYTNFYPNPNNNCTTGDICADYFGPDVSYESSAFGVSSNVSGYNPAQTSNYMRNNGRDWIMWYKKQTAVDGFRWDAVKHFPAYVQEDYSYNLKSVLPSWCKGGQNMFNVGEWVGSKNELDNYVNTIAAPTGDKMMGTFDFGLRAFDNSGGLYGMVYGMGNFNMATLPAAQQNERVTYYPATNTYVHRTVPFVNNHDTFRPQVSSTGNYIGWNSSGELSPHIEPNEPRLSAAYAVILAMDGNPQIFFEDLFDIGYNGNRYNHDPKSNASLPMRSDLQNLMWCHQALDFKSGPYQVPHASDDYLVIARAGKAIIGITDSWSTWQNQWVYTSFPAGTVLKDYSGANASTTVTVDGNGWAQISTPPVNPTLNIAGRRGYSVWAPVGLDANTYSPSRAITTTQEWEMAGDLGDRHASSLGQGGAIPGSSTNFRIVGKIFVESGKPLTYVLYPQNATKSLFLGVYNNAGTQLASVSGLGTLTGNYTPNFTGWITFKVRNSVSSNPTQKCWVNVTYTAPAVVTNAYAFPSNNTAAFWSGNGNDSNWYNENNWEEGKIPDASTDVIIPGNAFPQPAITDDANIAALILEEGSHIYLSGELSATEMSGNGVISGTGSLVVGGQNMSLSNSDNSSFKVFPNPFYDQLNVIAEGAFDATSVIRAELFSSDGRLISESSGTLSHINSMLNETLVPLQTGIYFLRVTGASSQFLRLVKE